MARLALVVASGVPHHITYRGNRRLDTFFSDEDHRVSPRLADAMAWLCGMVKPEDPVAVCAAVAAVRKSGPVQKTAPAQTFATAGLVDEQAVALLR